jgi:HrpA-like RNA helicase
MLMMLVFTDRGEAVLIFLPGIQSIEKLNKILRSRQTQSLLNASVRSLLCPPLVYTP